VGHASCRDPAISAGQGTVGLPIMHSAQVPGCTLELSLSWMPIRHDQQDGVLSISNQFYLFLYSIFQVLR
jgi:hypothetical protein